MKRHRGCGFYDDDDEYYGHVPGQPTEDQRERGDYNPSRTPYKHPLTLKISSVERTNMATNADTNQATFVLPVQVNDYVQVELISYCIPTTMYNVATGVNDSVYVSCSDPVSAASSTLALPQTNYTGTTLATAFALLFNTWLTTATTTSGATLVGSLTVTFSTVTGKLSFSSNITINATPVTFTLAFASTDALLAKNCARELGFLPTAARTYTIPNSLTYASPSVVQLDRPRSLAIGFDGCEWPTNKFIDGDGTLLNKNVQLFAPLPVTAGTIVYSDSTTYPLQTITFPNPISLRQFTVTFYDPDFGNVVNFNGGDWSMEVKLYFGRKQPMPDLR